MLKVICCRITVSCNQQGRQYSLNEIWDSDQIMIMSKHYQHHLINFSLCSSGSYNSDTTAKLNTNLMI